MNKGLFVKYLPEIAGTAAGALGGFLYWKYVGCLSGTCPLQSNPWIMLAYGGFTGLLLGNSLQEFLKKRKLKKAD